MLFDQAAKEWKVFIRSIGYLVVADSAVKIMSASTSDEAGFIGAGRISAVLLSGLPMKLRL